MQSRRALCTAAALCALAALWFSPRPADAFCGFYVAGAEQELYNDATMVVMMRQGTRTVLSMRNHYEGPPEGFAMVVPVPQVLQKENVRTLRDELFDQVDRLAAPRLVEYYEQNPCVRNRGSFGQIGRLGMSGVGKGGGGASGFEKPMVEIEAQFDVDEYEIVILSAKESGALQAWLEQNDYDIPQGAAPLYSPYIEQGMYFFVAKVDPEKVEFGEDGQAMLSPLRFHYDSEDFSLPVRLGLINADGPQDLLVHILAENQRYEVANYPNVAIPTNLVVDASVKERFAQFYATLFDRVTETHPGAVVTEYAWAASTCDPCPVGALRQKELLELGADIVDPSAGSQGAPSPIGLGRRFGASGWVLTRLHARYTADQLTEDLIFREAEPIRGGRGMPYGMAPMEQGVLGEQRAVPAPMNNFQGRYIVLNPWEGDLECDDPRRGVWGGPPGGGQREPIAAEDTAFVERDAVKLQEASVTPNPIALSNDFGSSTTRRSLQADGGGADDSSGPAQPDISDVERAEDARPSPMISSGEGEQSAQNKKSSCAVVDPAAGPGGPRGLVWLLAGLIGAATARRRRRR